MTTNDPAAQAAAEQCELRAARQRLATADLVRRQQQEERDARIAKQRQQAQQSQKPS